MAVKLKTEHLNQKLISFSDSLEYYADDMCLLNLLKAMCLKAMKSPLGAEDCLKTAMAFSGQLKSDTYLIPFAMFEYAVLLKEQGEDTLAMEHLERAKYEEENILFPFLFIFGSFRSDAA